MASTVASHFGRELAAAVRAVRLACRLSSAVQARLGDADTLTKSDHSPVTVGDFGVQALVVLALKHALATPAPTADPASAPREAASAAAPAFRLVAEEEASDLRENPSLLSRVVDEVNAVWHNPVTGAAWTDDDILGAVDSGNYDPVADTLAADSGADADARFPRYWVLDPIDGTKGFVRKEQYCVGLAFVAGGAPAVGVLGCPNLWLPQTGPAAGAFAGAASGGGESGDVGGSGGGGPGTIGPGCLFTAVRSQGARMLPLTAADGDSSGSGAGATAAEEGVRLSVSSETDASAVRFCESRDTGHSSRDVTSMIASTLGVTKSPIQCDSMVKYGVVARGEASLYLRFPRPGYSEKVWDHAGGWIVAKEAGGTVTDLWGKELDFTAGRRLHTNEGTIVSNGKVHAAVLEAAQAAYRAKYGDDVVGRPKDDAGFGDATGGTAGAGAGGGASRDTASASKM